MNPVFYISANVIGGASLLGVLAWLFVRSRKNQTAPAQLAHLQVSSHDTEAREQLAVFYANDLKRLDLALAELSQLINGANHKPKQVAHWLNLAATFQVKLGADVAAVQATLENIRARFPCLPVAKVAHQRLARLNNEFRGRQETAVIKLGVYEQNIGLKYGAPGRS